MPREDHHEMPPSILDLSKQLRGGKISPVDLTRQCLTRIEKLNPVLNAFITVTAESALAQARLAESEIQSGGWRGPLHGIPVGLKDLIDTAGVLTTAASAHWSRRIPSADAEVVRRLKQAGAILLGKHNLHEFAYGGSSLISHYGPVRNPWNRAHIAGGSSGGSAAAVAAGLGYAAIGTDTAGSIREPAALCGIVGLKPTYRRVSASGVFPMSGSLDHVGPITNSAADAAIVLAAVADPGAQPAGGSAGELLYDALRLEEKPDSLRVGVPRSFFYENLDPEIGAAVEQALAVIRTLTAETRDLAMTVDTDRTLQQAEAYAVHAELAATSPELYHPETLRRIREGGSISPSQLEQARRQLEQARREIEEVFAGVDVLVTPTTPLPAPVLQELEQRPEQLRPAEIVLLRNTRPFNAWGIPAISVPCGYTKAGLPIGLQICAAAWEEGKVLRLAHAYEQATEWSKRRPQL